ncbi:MAG TPA: GGDEF domain-containing protein [Candidatus Limnocylindrales bacterium]|nr:GGDEF domain-containing protein [Candidatus Limnocylindrales bacterium]
MTQPTEPSSTRGAEDPRIRRSWLVLVVSFFGLGLIVALRLVLQAHLIDWAIAALTVAVGFAAVRHRSAVQALEAGRRIEAESFARILQGLSRSVSPDAIVDAIVEELGVGTGADHVVIVRRRPDARLLEATLVNARTGGSSSSTLFPIADLEDPPDLDPGGAGRPLVGIPIEVDDVLAPAAPRPAPVRVVSSRGVIADDEANPRAGIDRRTPLGSLGGRGRDTDPALLVAERIAGRARSVFGLRHTLVAPLTSDRGQIGALLISKRTGGAWPPAASRLLVGAAVEASAALSRAYSHRQAEVRASTDALTGLPNRRYFDEVCALLARRRRSDDAVGILMIDIDRFKALNDRHGHPVGDEVLRAVAGAIVAAVREDDVPARYGGEEFAVLLKNPTPGVAVEVGERVREAVARLDLGEWGVPGVSVSVGAAVADDPDEPMAATIEAADRALYRAKKRGRDQVVAA